MNKEPTPEQSVWKEGYEDGVKAERQRLKEEIEKKVYEWFENKIHRFGNSWQSYALEVVGELKALLEGEK